MWRVTVCFLVWCVFSEFVRRVLYLFSCGLQIVVCLCLCFANLVFDRFCDGLRCQRVCLIVNRCFDLSVCVVGK